MSLRKGSNSKFLIPILLVLVLLLSGTALAQEPPPPDGKFPGARVDTSQETGKVTFIGAEAGQPLEVGKSTAPGLSAGGRADAVKAYVAPFFGVEDPKDLVQKAQHSKENRVTTRYQQKYKGVPVIGGELVLNLTGEGRLLAASGEASPDLDLSVQAKVNKSDARKTALAVTARAHQVNEDTLKVGEPELWVYDPQLLQPSEDPPELVWRLEVRSTVGDPINELVLVNAERGWVSLHFNQVDTAWVVERDQTPPVVESGDAGVLASPAYAGGSSQRETYDMHNQTSVGIADLICTQSTSCASDTDAYYADLYAGDAYTRYWLIHGRDSIDGSGMTIKSYVHYDTDYCNAFWDGYWKGMFYGDGCFIIVDDVVGHELTHGVTDYESNLLYWYESGAINESLSDVWGEYIDQTNGLGLDIPQVRWYMGEDAEGGAIRNMANPPEFGDPDSMTSKLYYPYPGDGGGVHYNSGVNNKAVYLMVDGGSFNKYNINAIGWDKTLEIYYDVQTSYLTSGSDYRDLYNVVYQSCLDKAGTGITLDDCTQVHKALLAVKMDQTPKQIVKAQAEVCPTGQQPDDLFFDDFESGDSQWSFGHVGSSSLDDWEITTDNAYNGDHSLYGPDDGTWGFNYADANPVSIPLDQQVYVHFLHEFGMEFYYPSDYWDGAEVSYSLDSGSNWVSAEPLFDKKGQTYNGKILDYSGGGNPFANQNAFVGNSGGWVSTRLDLSKDPAIAGQDFMLGFSIGTDDWPVTGYGWWVDDVRIYTCIDGPPDMPTGLKPADSATVVGAPQHSWKGNKKVDAAYQLQYADPDFNIVYESVEFTGTKFVPTFNLVGDYFWRVRAKSASDDWSDWTAFQKVTVLRDAPDAPVLVSPENRGATNDTTPTFVWNAVSYDGGGYQIMVSADKKFATTIIDDTTASGTTDYTSGSTLGEGVYYWMARAQNLDGIWSKWSKAASFTVDTTPPDAPINSKPKDNSYTNKKLVSFAWKFTTKDSKNSTLYISDCTNPVYDDYIPGNKYKMPTELDYGFYCWYVDAEDWAGNWSSSSSLNSLFYITLMKSPKPNSAIKGDIPKFAWNAHPDAKTAPAPRYEIRVDDDPNFGSPEAESGEVGNVTKYVWPASLSSGTWYWQIRFDPGDGSGWQDWMPNWAFNVP